MPEPVYPAAVEKIGGELAVAWSDGVESYLPLEFLRRHCPCASCAGEPDVTGAVLKPEVTYGPGSFELLGWETVGGYALRPKWGDGHSTGLFSYSALRQLAS